jgi:uncharacterized protein (UPF0212 family)
MTVDWNVVVNACGSVGGFALVGKWLIKSVERSNENIPVMIENLKTLNESVKELFKSRNRHEVELAEIKTGIDLCPNCNEQRHRRSTD